MQKLKGSLRKVWKEVEKSLKRKFEKNLKRKFKGEKFEKFEKFEKGRKKSFLTDLLCNYVIFWLFWKKKEI